MFGPVWTALYAGMGYASYLVYRDGGGLMSGAAGRWPLALYASQLALNWAWTPLFFGKHDLRSSFYEICAMWINIAACGLSFYAVNRTAGCLSLLSPVVADPESGGFLPPNRDGKNPDPGSGINIPDHISKSLVAIFWVKIMKFLLCVRGSGMEKLGSRIPDKHPGSATVVIYYYVLEGFGSSYVTQDSLMYRL